MEILVCIFAAIGTYLLVSINPSIVLAKVIYHQDIRKCGSGNPGFTNFKRSFGNKWAWCVFFLDLIKGAAVTALFAWFLTLHGISFQIGAAVVGCFALLAQAYPVWHGFKGGKGFLVYLSVVFVIDWRIGLLTFCIMATLLLTTKYMSVSTVAAMLCCPIWLAILRADLHVVLLCAACVIYIAVRHKENFKRLFKGEEHKFYFGSKKK